MPATGKEMDTGDITQVEPNIHAGVKYISLMRNQFFADQPVGARNKTLFAFAAYNAAFASPILFPDQDFVVDFICTDPENGEVVDWATAFTLTSSHRFRFMRPS